MKNQTQAIKKFMKLKKELKNKGYTISNKDLLSIMEFYYLDLHVQPQIDWFVETSNSDIINEMIELGDI